VETRGVPGPDPRIRLQARLQVPRLEITWIQNLVPPVEKAEFEYTRGLDLNLVPCESKILFYPYYV